MTGYTTILSATASIIITSLAVNSHIGSEDLFRFFSRDLHWSFFQELNPRENPRTTGKALWSRDRLRLEIGTQNGPATTIAPITIRKIEEFCRRHSGEFAHIISRATARNDMVNSFSEIEGIHTCRSEDGAVLFDVDVGFIGEARSDGSAWVYLSPHFGENSVARARWERIFSQARPAPTQTPILRYEVGAPGKIGDEEVLIVEVRPPIAQVQFSNGNVRWVRTEEIVLTPPR